MWERSNRTEAKMRTFHVDAGRARVGPPTEKEEGRLPVGQSAALIAGLSALSWAGSDLNRCGAAQDAIGPPNRTFMRVE